MTDVLEIERARARATAELVARQYPGARVLGGTVSQGVVANDGAAVVHLDGDPPESSVPLPVLLEPNLQGGQRVAVLATDQGMVVLGGVGPAPQWQTYVPTWAAADGPPVVGNGSLLGRYFRIGTWVYVEIYLGFGTTTNGSTGGYGFGLPFSAAGASNEQEIVAKAFVTGGFNFCGVGYIPNGGTVYPYLPTAATDCRLQQARNATTGGAVGTGVPLVSGNFTWTSGTNLVVCGAYECDGSV